ncbi:hypothetical protein P976_00587 [Mycobacterium tuberculosis KT-0100]|nr:hypothetical protein P976_00587 [Mycobacterium tuberculosis KT-0100]
MSGGSSRRYPPELRERAVRMVAEIRGQHDSEWAAISEVARLLGVGCAETVRKWVRPTAAQLEEISTAWREWAAAPDGWLAIPHGEILCRA